MPTASRQVWKKFSRPFPSCRAAQYKENQFWCLNVSVTQSCSYPNSVSPCNFFPLYLSTPLNLSILQIFVDAQRLVGFTQFFFSVKETLNGDAPSCGPKPANHRPGYAGFTHVSSVSHLLAIQSAASSSTTTGQFCSVRLADSTEICPAPRSNHRGSGFPSIPVPGHISGLILHLTMSVIY
jgi:hypothetical protein